MSLKYFSAPRIPLVIHLARWIFFNYLFFYASAACQPPDSPEGGSYKPEQTRYLPGDKVAYSCKDRLTRIGKEIRICQTTGKWTGSIPFCDSPAKIRNPGASSDPNGQVANVVDGSPSTCYRSRNNTGNNIKVYLDQPAAVNVIRIYLPKGKVKFKVNIVQKKYPVTSAPCTSYERDLEENQWTTLECQNNEGPADYIYIEDSSSKSNILAVCEIEVYVKDDVWCKNSPELFIPNGRLEVSRDKATLRCLEGFKARDNTRLVCEKNSWAGPNLQCEEILCDANVGNETFVGGEWQIEGNARKLSVGTKRKLVCRSNYYIEGKPQLVTCFKNGTWSRTSAICVENKSDKLDRLRIIAVAVGAVVILVVIILLGLTIYLIQKKRAREVVVIYKPGEDGYAPSSVTNTTGCSDSEYSTVYYDAMHNAPYPPTSSRPRPSPNLERGYSKPVDDCGSPTSTLVPKKLPTDLAFGSLKSSALYSSMK
ncbi:c4b-binding protein [Trichonephila clavata]|uniref:C4b-binding protein n=1 Tax=Trichonephila clavata TaxID=2740835 RepID=A0A8X6K469_TRICU|nr:c4b-binding protein [Trichonephila clavata]